MKLQLEIYEQGYSDMSDLKEFWMTEWNKILKGVTGKDLNEKAFDSQDYFYVIRFEQKIIGVMSSARQNVESVARDDEYYSAWSESVSYLKSIGITNYHKMGMIIGKKELIPEYLRMAPTIIGCGLKFVKTLSNCEGVVSFPRVDNIVYRSCVEWGAKDLKTGLMMYNTPVNFIIVKKNDFKEHQNPQILNLTNDLWVDRIDYTSYGYQKVG